MRTTAEITMDEISENDSIKALVEEAKKRGVTRIDIQDAKIVILLLNCAPGESLEHIGQMCDIVKLLSAIYDGLK